MRERSICFSRRAFLRVLGVSAGIILGFEHFVSNWHVWAQTSAPGFPLPDELVGTTLKRLFGERKFQPGEGKIKLELPTIAEDGGNVALSIDSELPVTGAVRASNIYIVADRNRRPMLAKFTLTSDSGRAAIATSIRLATSTDVRAVIEMSDGTLYATSKPVRVTISGCDLPPQS